MRPASSPGTSARPLRPRFPKVIGHIQTAIGSGTLTRAGGIAVQAVGDPVCQGDVIETAADGRVGLRFIDGTGFKLSGSARMVLDEFVCDANGTSHSALFGVTRGTFAFIAGQVAKSGCLRIDTPVGSIRGRAHTGGIGMLSLTALIFSMMKEVQAADPNATFLDDDSIGYKDLEHGKFELVTKEAIPRHIIVEDPGETIVLNKIGSSVSVNQVANSPTRMAELQEVQQEALATYAKGLGPSGSSTPSSSNRCQCNPSILLRRATTAAQTLLAPLPSMGVLVPEIIIVHPPPPPPPLPEPPTLTCGEGADRKRYEGIRRLHRDERNFRCQQPKRRRRTDLRHERGGRHRHGTGRGRIRRIGEQSLWHAFRQ